MGYPKGLIEFNKIPLLEYQIESFFKHGGKKAIVVLGYQKEKYIETLGWISKALESWLPLYGGEVIITINHDCHKGQFSSIQKGLSLLKNENISGHFILPIDVPTPSKPVWENMAIEKDKDLPDKIYAIVPKFKNKKGHPVLLAKDFIELLLKVSTDSFDGRLDFQLNNLPKNRCKLVNVDCPKILKNFNYLSCIE